MREGGGNICVYLSLLLAKFFKMFQSLIETSKMFFFNFLLNLNKELVR